MVLPDVAAHPAGGSQAQFPTRSHRSRTRPRRAALYGYHAMATAPPMELKRSLCHPTASHMNLLPDPNRSHPMLLLLSDCRPEAYALARRCGPTALGEWLHRDRMPAQMRLETRIPETSCARRRTPEDLGQLHAARASPADRSASSTQDRPAGPQPGCALPHEVPARRATQDSHAIPG